MDDGDGDDPDDEDDHDQAVTGSGPHQHKGAAPLDFNQLLDTSHALTLSSVSASPSPLFSPSFDHHRLNRERRTRRRHASWCSFLQKKGHLRGGGEATGGVTGAGTG
eukprot:767936-Hanusia_phi.AAC.1